ncbi:hypothetical protein [Sphingobacterium sp. LRF_L2]|uniref:hypothetical protein n=1 Tax=Sphingobacterium sp. LRF_L2 TaxID=3369421 RepID=UPI003F64432F
MQKIVISLLTSFAFYLSSTLIPSPDSTKVHQSDNKTQKKETIAAKQATVSLSRSEN